MRFISTIIVCIFCFAFSIQAAAQEGSVKKCEEAGCEAQDADGAYQKICATSEKLSRWLGIKICETAELARIKSEAKRLNAVPIASPRPEKVPLDPRLNERKIERDVKKTQIDIKRTAPLIRR